MEPSGAGAMPWVYWVKACAFGLTIVGLLVEVRGVYVTASLAQPFTFSGFLGELFPILRGSFLGFRRDRVGSDALRRILALKEEVDRGGPETERARRIEEAHGLEVLHIVAGMAWILTGIILQVLGTALLTFIEFRH
jgi:hypothetical protein